MDLDTTVLSNLVQSIGLEFSEYTRRQAYGLVGIYELVNTDKPDSPGSTIDIAEPGLTTERLKKFKRTVLRFHPDRYNGPNKDDTFRLFRHAYAYFKSATKNRERINAGDPFAFPSEYQSTKHAHLIDAAVKRDQPFDQNEFNNEYDRRHSTEEADNHGWWRDTSVAPTQRLDQSAYAYFTPEQTQVHMQLVIRQTMGDLIIPANMDDGYLTAASSSKLPYDDIRKVYHDKTWTNIDALERELGHRIRGNVSADYSARVNTYKTGQY